MSQQLIVALVIVYVAITLLAPALLARPEVLSRHPGAVLIWWFIFLGIASVSLIAALIGLVIRALRHHVSHIEGHGVLLPIMDNVLGWVAIAVLGIITFRLGAAVSEQRNLKSRHILEIDALTVGVSPQAINGVRVYTVESPKPFVAASPHLRGVIISDNLLNSLTDEQIAAVLTHEQKHLNGNHSTIRFLGAIALATAPGFTASTRMAQATRIATELIADDAAVTQCGAETVISALEACYADSDTVQLRIARLC